MNEVQKKAIKQIVEQEAFKYIEQVFIDEILEGKKPLNFKTEGKTAEMIAIEAMAREKASKMVTSALLKLKRFKKETISEKRDWK
jgi:hypothetical protein